VGVCDAHTGRSDAYLPFLSVMAQLTGEEESGAARGPQGAEGARRLRGLASLSVKTVLEHAPDLIGAFLPAAGLLRGLVDGGRTSLLRALPWLAVPAALILALALATASRPLFTAGYLGAVAAVLALLGGLGLLVRWGSAKVPRPRSPFLRLALASLHRPGAGTIGLVVALGVGLTMFVQIAAELHPHLVGSIHKVGHFFRHRRRQHFARILRRAFIQRATRNVLYRYVTPPLLVARLADLMFFIPLPPGDGPVGIGGHA
jgi:hypothetical protein